MCCTHQVHGFHRVWMCARIWERACVSLKMCMWVRTSVHMLCTSVCVYVHVCACVCIQVCMCVTVNGFITVTMHNAIVPDFLLLFCRMMYCQLSNIGLDTGHTEFDTSLLDLDFTLATCWPVSSALIIHVFNFVIINKSILLLPAIYISLFFCHSC